MIKFSSLKSSNSGMVLVGVIVFVSALTIVGFALVAAASSQYSIASRGVFTANATLVAEAGIEHTLHELNVNDDFAGFASEQVYFDNETQGRAVYTTTVTDMPDTNARTVVSTGGVYRFGDTTDPVSTESIKVTIVGTNAEGYAVHSGPGGLILGGSANITNSDVYVNGGITMKGAAKIGTHSQPLNVNVAHMTCPSGSYPGESYPSVCTSGEPISMAWSTKIYGSVCATNQMSDGPDPSGNILPGNGGSGLMPDCVAPPVAPPTYDKAAHVAAVTTTASASDNTYVCNSWPFDRTWPANLRLDGNVSIASSCNLVITGDAYITGDLNLGGAARITVADSVGTDRPVVLVDGKITAGGSAQVIANSEGTGVHFISYKADASCNPDCTELSGNELKSSQEQETVTIGGGGNLAGMIFQAQWGTLRLRGSGNIGSAIGQKIDMNGAGTVTFGTTLSSGERSWTVTSYQRVFDL